MKYRKLGHSDICVSALAIGCWSFGGGSYWGAQSQSDVNDVVSLALDQGITLFDTAEAYNDGASETSLGIALRGRRDRAVVLSKVSTCNACHDTLIEHCEASLKRLGTDYLDMYMLHWPINDRAIVHFAKNQDQMRARPTIEGVMTAMDKLLRDGKIRTVGLSNFGTNQLREAQGFGVPVDANEIAYNIFSRAIESQIVPYCVANDISIIGSMALQQGILTGKYTSPDQVPMHQAHSRHFSQERGKGTSRHFSAGAEREMFTALEQIRAIADACGTSMARLAIAWTIEKPGIISTLVGCRSVAQLEENIQAAELCLSSEIISRIDRISQPVLDVLGDNPDYYESSENSRIC